MVSTLPPHTRARAKTTAAAVPRYIIDTNFGVVRSGSSTEKCPASGEIKCERCQFLSAVAAISGVFFWCRTTRADRIKVNGNV